MKNVISRLLVVSALMAGAAVYLGQVSKAEELPARTELAALPMTIDGWRGRREPDFTPEILAVLGAEDYTIRTYFKDDEYAGLYVGYHASQRQGDTIHSPLNCLPGAGWQPTDSGRIMIPVKGAPGTTGDTPIEVNSVVISKGIDRQLVLYWYQSHRRVVASEYWGKIYTVLDAVRYNRTDAALVRVIMPIREGESKAAAEQKASGFVKSLFPLLAPHLPS